MTKYVLLESYPNSGPEGTIVEAWVVVGEYEAHGPEGALRQHVDGHENDGGRFVAIPARSFVEMKVEPVEVTTTKITRVDGQVALGETLGESLAQGAGAESDREPEGAPA